MKKMILKQIGKWMLCAPLLLIFGCASFELISNPPADVYENGEVVAQTPYKFDLVAGQRNFTLRKSGYVDMPISVSPLDIKKRSVQLEWVGLTRILTQPTGADIIRVEDEEELGKTPCGLRLSAPVKVLIQREGFKSLEYELIPNERYVLELEPIDGFRTIVYRDINFTSEQGNVVIYDRFKGRKIGTTPARLTIQAGTEIEYRLKGYKTKRQLVSKIFPGRMPITLEPLVSVTLKGPEGATVYRVGSVQPLGQLPFTIEIPQDMLFEVKKEGYYDSQVALAPGSPSEVKVELKKIPYKTILTTPTGAEIYRVGGLEKLGVSPFTTVVNDDRVFEIRKAGYKTEVVGMGVESPEKLKVTLTASPHSTPDAAAIGELGNTGIGSF